MNNKRKVNKYETLATWKHHEEKNKNKNIMQRMKYIKQNHHERDRLQLSSISTTICFQAYADAWNHNKYQTPIYYTLLTYMHIYDRNSYKNYTH